MTWEIFYLGCFILGLLLCVISLITGGHTHGGHFHFGGHAHVHLPRGGHGHTTNNVSPFNGFTITAFLCWFGAVGYLLRGHSGLFAPVVLLLASLSGLAGGGLIFWFLASVLVPHERALTAEETEITGVVARVSGPLHRDGTGEIIYTQLGARRSAPARSEDGSTIERGEEVVVLRYERGIAYVRPWHDMDL